MERFKIYTNEFVFNKQVTVGLEQLFDFDRDFDIQQIIEEKTKESINPTNDVEVKRFKPFFEQFFSFDFEISGQTSYNVLFTDNEILNLKQVYKNSTWIIEVFDSMVKSTQNRLFINFYSPERKYINNQLVNDISMILHDGYKVIDNKGYSNIFIPRNFFTENQTIKDVYIKFRFFCGKNGKTYTFRKKTLNTDIQNSDYYFEIKLDNLNNIWYISDQNSSFTNYENNLIQNDENNKQPNIITDDNKDKGDFINTNGKYQSGGNEYNEPC